MVPTADWSNPTNFCDALGAIIALAETQAFNSLKMRQICNRMARIGNQFKNNFTENYRDQYQSAILPLNLA
jgi:hypothetical protein